MSETRSMTNPQFAELIGMHFTFASRLRTGQRKPSLSTMVKISSLFDWSLDDQAKAMGRDNWHILLEQRIDQYAKTHEVA